MPISKRLKTAPGLLAGALALSGCLEPGTGPGQVEFVAARLPQSVDLDGGALTIAAPRGYCIDAGSVSHTAGGGFAVAAPCSGLSGNGVTGGGAIMTALVSPVSGARVAPAMDQLEAFFTSEAGRAALSRAGDGETVTVLETKRDARAGLFLIHASDSAAQSLGDVSNEYWRGLFDLEGRIVTVTVQGLNKAPLSSQAALSQLRAFARRIRSANS